MRTRTKTKTIKLPHAKSEAFYNRVRAAQDRADALRDTADVIDRHLGDPKGTRYDAVGGRVSGPPTDAMAEAIMRLERAQSRAQASAESAEALVAEGAEYCVKALEREDLNDAQAILAVLRYYVERKSLKSIADEFRIGVPGVSRAKERGLVMLERLYF